MQPSEQLQFVPYAAPPFHLGDRVLDERRGIVEIVGVSDGRIQWPIGARLDGTRPKALVLYADLAKAVRNESGAAIRYWWGVSYFSVTAWRQALQVGRSNPGSHRLWSLSCEGAAGQKARKAGLKVTTSSRYAKECRERAVGKPAPPAMIEAARLVNTGKKRSAESIAKQMKSRRQGGINGRVFDDNYPSA